MEITRAKKITNSKDNILELILKEIREIKEDVAILKEDVAILKEDVAVLKQDVADIKKCPTVAKELAKLKLEK